MSLIKCIDCGNMISNNSEICVHCGCPTKKSIHILEEAPKRKGFSVKKNRLVKYFGKDEHLFIPEEVIVINNNAIIKRKFLKKIFIHKLISDIKPYAIMDCPNLIEIVVDEKNNDYCSIDGNLYSKDKTVLIRYAIGKLERTFSIPQGVVSIAENAFWGCQNLELIKIPSTLKSVGIAAFAACVNLREIAFHDGVVKIGPCAFAGCVSLNNIKLPLGEEKERFGYKWRESLLSEVGNEFFYGCHSLKRIKIPYGVKYIGVDAFCGCKNLKEIEIPDSVTCIWSRAFYLCESLERIEIPASVQSIQSDAFPPKCKIIGEKNSVAHKYAMDNNLEFIVVDRRFSWFRED